MENQDKIASWELTMSAAAVKFSEFCKVECPRKASPRDKMSKYEGSCYWFEKNNNTMSDSARGTLSMDQEFCLLQKILLAFTFG